MFICVRKGQQTQDKNVQEISSILIGHTVFKVLNWIRTDFQKVVKGAKGSQEEMQTVKNYLRYKYMK